MVKDTDGLWDKIKNKISPVDETIINLPVGHGDTEIGDIFREILDPKNIFQTANIDGVERVNVVLGDAYCRNRPKSDIEGFFASIWMNMLETSVSRDGWRTEGLQNMAVGQLSQSFQLQLAKARNPNAFGDNQLKDVF